LGAAALYAAAFGHDKRLITAFFSLLAALLAGTSAIIALWLTPARAAMLRQSAPAPAFYIAGGAVLMAALGWAMRLEWLHAAVTLAGAVTLTLGYLTLYWDRPTRVERRWFAWALLAVPLLVAVIRAYGLSVYPPIHDIDEGWTLGWALSHMRTGQVTDLLGLGLRPPAGLPMFYAGLSLWLQIVGVGLWQARLFSLGLTLLAAALTALAVHQLYGKQAARTALIMAVSSVVLAHAARIRHDVGLTLAVAVALGLHTLALKRADLRLHALAGAAVGLGLLAHFHAALFGPALLIGLYAPRLLAARRASRRHVALSAVCFGAGGLAAAALAFTVQVVPDLSQGDAIIVHSVQVVPDVEHYLPLVAAHFANIAAFSLFELLLIVSALGAALWRRKATDLCLALSLILAHLALGIANYASTYYVIPLTPLYVALLSGLFSQPLLRTSYLNTPGIGRAALAFCVVPLLTASLSAPAAHLLGGKSVYGETPPAAQWVLENIPSCATVVGYPYYFLWLTEYRYAYPFLPGVLSARDRERYATREALWDAVGVDVFLFNSRLIEQQDLMLTPDYFETRGYTVAVQIPEGRYISTILVRPNMCGGGVRSD